MKKIYSTPQSVTMAFHMEAIMESSIKARNTQGNVDGENDGWHTNDFDFEDDWDDIEE